MGKLKRLVLFLVLPGALILYAGQPPVYADSNDGMVAHGPTATAEFDKWGFRHVTGWGCTVVGYWGVDAQGKDWLFGDLECRTGGLQDDTYLTLTATDGLGCSFSMDDVNIDETDEQSQQGVIFAPNPQSNCGAITQLCADVTVDSILGPDTGDPISGDGCVPWAVGAPPDTAPTPTTTTGCAGLGFGQPVYTAPVMKQDTNPDSNGNYNYHYENAKVTFPNIGTDASHPLTGYRVYAIFGNTTGDGGLPVKPYNGMLTSSVPYPTSTSVRALWATPSGSPYTWTFSQGVGVINTSSPYDYPPLIGVGISYRPSVGSTGTPSFQNGKVPPFADSAYPGYSDPATCTFYWGQKVVDAAGTTADEPLSGYASGTPSDGGVAPTIIWNITGDCTTGATCAFTPDNPNFGNNNDDPGTDQPQDGSSCGGGLSLWNPLTWAGAGLCAVVAAVMQAVKVLAKLVDAVAGLIGDLLGLLKDLFIPDPGSWDFGGLNDQVKARAPFSWVGSLGSSVGAVGTAYGGAGSTACAGLDTIAGGSGSCTVPPALTAARSVVSVLLLALTGWYVFTLIGAAVKE